MGIAIALAMEGKGGMKGGRGRMGTGEALSVMGREGSPGWLVLSMSQDAAYQHAAISNCQNCPTLSSRFGALSL